MPDRGAPVGLDLDSAAPLRRSPGEDLRDDRLRILAAGVVGGDDDPIGEASRPISPISGRFPRSRSPPHPKTQIEPPAR